MARGIKARGDFPVEWPDESRQNVYIRFTFGSLEKLHDAFGENYMKKVLDGIRAFDPKVIRTCLQVGLHGVDVGEYLDTFPVGEIEVHLEEAISLGLYGRTVDEQVAFEDEQTQKQMERVKKNPRLREAVGALIANALQSTPSEQDSDPTRSGN